MSYLIPLLLQTLLFGEIAFAQNMGHPGGGVANEPNAKLIAIKCADAVVDSAELEEKFLKSWDKKYKSSADFILLMKELNGKFLIDDFKPFLIHGTEVKNYVCDQGEEKKFSTSVAERPSYKKELKMLEKLKLSWEVGITNIREGNACFEHMSSRKSEYENLVTLIKNYKKASGE